MVLIALFFFSFLNAFSYSLCCWPITLLIFGLRWVRTEVTCRFFRTEQLPQRKSQLDRVQPAGKASVLVQLPDFYGHRRLAAKDAPSQGNCPDDSVLWRKRASDEIPGNTLTNCAWNLMRSNWCGPSCAQCSLAKLWAVRLPWKIAVTTSRRIVCCYLVLSVFKSTRLSALFLYSHNCS